jgi:4-aminobutyrate aminotransferase
MPLVGDVRGLGLLLAVELNRDRDPGEPARREAEKVLYRCLSLGLSFKVSAGNCLTLTPPLTIAQDEMDRALDILEQAIEEAANERAIHSV